MYIRKMYKYRKNGRTYISSTVPEDAELLETMDILNAEDGYDLIRISNEENMGPSVWLRNGDIQENYKEEEHKEPEITKE